MADIIFGIENQLFSAVLLPSSGDNQMQGSVKLREYQEKVAPVKVGESYDVSIDDIAKEGDGIARVEGFVIFVPQTKVGDKVKIKVNKVMRKFAIAEKTT